MLEIMLTTEFTLKLCSLPIEMWTPWPFLPINEEKSNNKYASNIQYAVPKKFYSNASTDG